jgi:hypothetical protein
MLGTPPVEGGQVRASLCDDTPRSSSPLIRCAASFGPRPLTDADVDTIRKLVSRMATFAAYRACIPEDVESMEEMERWQRQVWSTEAHRKATRTPTLAADPKLRGSNAAHTLRPPSLGAPGERSRAYSPQHQPASRQSKERPASSRGKVGSGTATRQAAVPTRKGGAIAGRTSAAAPPSSDPPVSLAGSACALARLSDAPDTVATQGTLDASSMCPSTAGSGHDSLAQTASEGMHVTARAAGGHACAVLL